MAISRLGFGTILQVDFGSGSFQDIALITSVTPPGVTAEVVDKTHMGSPDGFREKMGGLKSWGQVTVNCHYDPSDPVTADLIAACGETLPHRVRFPDNTTLTFDAVVVSFVPGEATMEGLMTATYTAEVTGKPSDA